MKMIPVQMNFSVQMITQMTQKIYHTNERRREIFNGL